MVDVVDAFQMRVFHQRDLVETGHHFAHFLKRRLERSKALHISAGAHVFVMVQNGQAVLVAHRHNRFRKAVVGPSGRGTALGFNGQRIGVITAKTVFGCDNISRDALWNKVGVHCDRRINGNRRAVAAHGHAAHHFNAARNIGHACAAFDLVGSKVHCLHARGAKTVDRKTGDRLIQIRSQNSSTGKAPALFAHLGHVAPDHVLHGVAVQTVAVFQGVQNLRGQAHAGHFVQRAVLAALAARGAHGVIDIGFGHISSSRGGRECPAH